MKRIFNTDLPGNSGHVALLIFRVIAAIFMLTHGIPKLQKLLSGAEIQFADPYGLGPTVSFVLVIFAEFLCSLLVILGLATRLAVIPLMITVATAVIFAHADDPFGTKEKPLLFLLIFALLCVFGSGRYSVDRILEKRNSWF
ncbi:MAG: DoxX family protein [Cyclobacteriaceae bacterium]